MIHEVIAVFLIGHMAGDFYLQSSSLAERKENSGRALALHGVFYFMAAAGTGICIFGAKILIWCFGISAVHILLDYVKTAFKNKCSISQREKNTYLYLTDQFLHIFTILAAGVVISMTGETFAYTPFIKILADSFDLNIAWGLSVFLAVLTVMRPCSIMIRVILSDFRMAESRAGVKNAGALIGMLERLIMLMLLLAGQYGAMGFVLTAKSIARYNKIADDPQFGEYYLLGTLLSSVLVIAVYMLVL